MVRRNLPLARQVVNELLAGIESGKLARANGMLPSEAELSQRYGVSRATIREALAQLEHRGAVMRRHGVGTFVTALPRLDAGLEELESLETLARRIGLETRMSDLQIEERAANEEEAGVLQLTDHQVLSVSRVIVANKRPVAYLIDTVPTSILKQQDLDKNFRGSVLDVLIRRRDLNLSHSHTDILIEPANAAIARKLHIKRGEPLQKLQAQLYVREGCVIDYSISYFVPGYFHFHVIRRIGKSQSL